MHRVISAAALISIACCLPASAAGHGPVPPASFLQYSVKTVPELGQEVTISPRVRARLARHFHVSYAEIGRYVLHNLSLSKLGSAGLYRVACIGPNGDEYWVTSRLPAGTPVFTSRVNGQPVLKLACGNPMTSSLPPEQEATVDDHSKLAPPLISQSTSAPGENTAFVPPALMAETPLLDALLAPGTEALLLEQPPVVKTAGSLEFAGLLPAQSLADLGPVLATAAALAAVSSGGRHKGSTNPPNPVPEASSSAAFGTMLLIGGIGGMGLMVRRKHSA